MEKSWTIPFMEFQPVDPLKKHWSSSTGKGALYTLEGDFFGSPFRRRMTLICLEAGGLILHSPILLSPEDRARILTPLGEVIGLIAPNSLHCDDTPAYSKLYPNARVVVPSSQRSKLAKLGRVDQSLDEPLSDSWKSELSVISIGGLRDFFKRAFFCIHLREA